MTDSKYYNSEKNSILIMLILLDLDTWDMQVSVFSKQINQNYYKPWR
jgi:hypothetical protein